MTNELDMQNAVETAQPENEPKTAVVEAKSGDVVTAPTQPENSFDIGANDISVPVVLLMQSISKAVKDRKAFAGDLYDSLDEVVIPKPLEFLPVGMYKTIITYEDSIKVRTEPWSHNFEMSLQKEGYFQKEPIIKNGVRIAKSVALNYYAILIKDIVDMTPFPKVLRFVRTSSRAGKNLSTHILKLEDFGAKPWAKVFILDTEEESGDKGEYSVLKVSMGRKAADFEMKIAEKWFNRLKGATVTVHEAEEVDETTTPQGTAEASHGVKAEAGLNF